MIQKKKSSRKVISYVLALVMVLSTMTGIVPGMSQTAYAAGENAYAAYDVTTETNKTKSGNDLTALQVTFNERQWYIIEDNSSSATSGTVTLLSADTTFGTKIFADNNSNKYSTSQVKAYLDSMTETGNDFADVADAIETVNLTTNKYNSTDEYETVDGVKLYLLSTEEANSLPTNVRKAGFTGDDCDAHEWWLRSPGNVGNNAAFVYGDNGDVNGDANDEGYYVWIAFGVRPALKLNLGSVIFDSKLNTFKVGTASTTVTSADELKNAAENTGGRIVLEDDIEASDPFYFRKDAELDLNGHTFTTLSYFSVDSEVKLTIRDSAGGGKIVLTDDTYIKAYGTITLESGTIEGVYSSFGVIGVDGEYGGSFIMNGGTVGGTVSGAKSLCRDGGTITINGGTVNGEFDGSEGDLTITGGIFDFDVSGFVAEGTKVKQDGSYWVVGENAGEEVPEESSTTVKSADELKNAANNTGGKIVLGDDIEASGWFYFEKDAELDLNGHTFTTSLYFGVDPEKKLTIRDSAGGGKIVFTYDYEIRAFGTITLESGTIEGLNSSNGVIDVDGGTFIMNGGTVSGEKSLWRDGGTITINGGTVNGEFYGNEGNLTITGGSFDFDVSGFVADGTTVKKNGSYWVVEKPKPEQTITASDVTATYGDTDKEVSAAVTVPATDGGEISYAVKSGSENYIDVAYDGKLTIKAVPQTDGKAYVIVTAAETSEYAQTDKEVTIKIDPRITIVAGDDGSKVETEEDGFKTIVTEKDSEGKVTKTTETVTKEDGSKIETITEGNKTTVTEKDSEGKVTKTTETVVDGNKTTVTEKDSEDKVTKTTETVTKEDGSKTETVTEGNKTTVTETDKQNQITKTTETVTKEDGSKTETVTEGNKTTVTEKDSENKVIKITETATKEDGSKTETVTEGNKTTVTEKDSEGKVTKTTETVVDGNKTTVTEKDSSGQIIKITETVVDGNTITVTEKDPDDQITKTTETVVDGNKTTVTEKDSENKVIKITETVTKEDGSKTETVTEGNKTTVTEKDSEGKVTKTTETVVDGNKTTVTEKDSENKVIKTTETVTKEDGSKTETVTEGNKTTVTEINPAGNMTKTTETVTEGNKTTVTEKDSKGEPTKITETVTNEDGTTTETSHKYDTNGNETEITQTITKDGKITGRKETKVNPDGSTTVIDYNKETQKKAADALAEEDDSDASKKLIADAKVAIDALQYDESKTLDENMAVVEAILIELKSALTTQRAADKKDADDTDTVNKVTGAINALPAGDKVTTADKAAIEAARKAYDALTADQKKKVSANTLKKLEDAEKALEAAEKKDTADADAAKQKVTDAINKLPASDKVTTADKEAIEAARKAYDALTADQKKKVPADVLKKLTDAEKTLAAAEAADKAAEELEAAKQEAQPAMDEQVTVTQKGNKFTVKWTKAPSADGYYVYASYCGKKATKPVKTIKKNTTTKATITKINGKKINQKKNFHVYVAPYKIIDGKKVTLGKSTVAHLVGSKNAKYSNVKKLTLTKSKYTVKVGNTKKIKAKVTLVNKNKKHIPKGHGAKFRYKSSDTSIATVDKNGKIKGIKKGTCTIYVYSINGLVKKAKVTVK